MTQQFIVGISHNLLSQGLCRRVGPSALAVSGVVISIHLSNFSMRSLRQSIFHAVEDEHLCSSPNVSSLTLALPFIMAFMLLFDASQESPARAKT